MPELPEVETMRRGIASIAGSQITRIDFPAGKCKPIAISPGMVPFRQRVVGQPIMAIDRRGKKVLVRLGSGDALIFEPRMTGLVLLSTGQPLDPPDQDHVRVVVHLSYTPSPQLLFWDRRGLGSVYLLSPAEQQIRLEPPRLGPDAWGISLAQLKQPLQASHTPIKVALLDQSRVAGIGNLYASEILFVARIHPAVPCCQISAAGWKKLHAAMQQVLDEAIRYEGSTLADGTYRNALNQSGSYQNHHRVYQRANQGCVACGRAKVQRMVQAQRSTFWCPRCQKERP